jgi:glycosyltransferase involved in cell wall biosynthesis
MRIAQIAPLSEAVPPKLYGGTERVVSWLTEELVAQGHEVTLFAAGGSQTSAHLVACSPRGLRLAGISDHLASHLVMLNEVYERAHEFDVIHFHIDLIQYVLFKDLTHKCVTTLHGRLDLPDFAPIYRSFPNMPLVSISRSQRAPMPPNVFWLGNVSHGLPASVCPYNAGGGDYLAFLGRIAPEKRPDRAIEIAKRAGVPLKIAAKIDKADEDYFREVVAPLLDHPLIEFVGEISEQQKNDFLGNALALLFPIDWPEPFGLVMIEAMSAGTPVIAWCNGSVPEVIDNGVSGLIIDSLEEAVTAVRRVKHINRAVVRKQFESRFTAHRMAESYVEAYERLLAIPASRRRRSPGLLRIAARSDRATRFHSEAGRNAPSVRPPDEQSLPPSAGALSPSHPQGK